MAPPFSRAEYAGRLRAVQTRMREAGLDALFLTDPANVNWLCGFDAWSFYVPQALLVEASGDQPVWMGRLMDAGAARFTTYLDDAHVLALPEDYVQRPDIHPGDWMAERLIERGLARAAIGYESDHYFLSPRWFAALGRGTPEARWIDADRLVNWARFVKSEAELAVMAEAAGIAGVAMRAAFDGLRPGIRQCDLMAEVVGAQIRGLPNAGGHLTAVYPLMLAGEKASTAHPMWDDSPLEADQTVAFELGGCRSRYNAGLARTVHIGRAPDRLIETAKAVEEGLEAVLAVLRAGVSAGEAHRAWRTVLDRRGLEKPSRIGYSIGVGYAPDWGERTVSLRPNDSTLLPENAVIHVMLGMWMDGWGMELSETVRIRTAGCEALTNFPRAVFETG